MEEDNSKNVSIPYSEIKNLALCNIMGWVATTGAAAWAFAYAPNTPARLTTGIAVVGSAITTLVGFSSYLDLKKHSNNPPKDEPQAERPRNMGQKIPCPDNRPK